jgi:hypothetical protein
MEVRTACTRTGTFSATAGLALARALLSNTPTSGTETMTVRVPSANRPRWAVRAAVLTRAWKLEEDTAPRAVATMSGRKAVRSGSFCSTAVARRSPTKSATRGSSRLAARRSANASG